MIEIKILGPGCPKCQVTETQVKYAVSKLDRKDIQIIKVENIEDIMNYHIMSTPALVVNGKIKSMGKVPSVEDIKRYISEASDTVVH